MAQTRGQKVAKFPKLYGLLGNGSELCHSELPTLRQCLRYGLFLRERSLEDMAIREMCRLVLAEMKTIWNAANTTIPLVSEKYALDKLVKEWNNAKQCSKETAKAALVSQFNERLDKLFDLCKCKCNIYECAEKSCDGCEHQAHVNCTCPRNEKIPLMELKFMKCQRNKVGDRSDMQIGTLDKPESKRQARLLKRKERESNHKRARSSSDDILLERDQENSEEMDLQDEYDNKDDPDVMFDRPSSRNYLNVSRISSAAVRYGVSNRAAAAISTATLAAARDAGLLKEDCDIIIDQNKIRRSKTKVMREKQADDELKLEEANIQGILFDGRKDMTKFMKEGDDGKLHPSEKKEDHYSVCSEPGGNYLFHFTVDPKERTGSAAEQIATLLYEWIVDHGLDVSLLAVGGDSTNVNTGWKGGTIHFLEKKLGRKLIWLICALHTNELPLRHLVIDLDGKTISDNKFLGPIGKLLSNVTSLKVKDKIPKLDVEIELIELDSEIVRSLSHDQKYLYEITRAIKSGTFPNDLREREIGRHSHARWLNLANRLCRAWCSEHTLPQDVEENLRRLVEFTVGVYSPLWFEIKVKNSWIEGPYHILRQLQLVRKQTQKVQNIVMPYVKSSAWNAHSENVLQTLLCSSDTGDREFAVDTILNLRGDSEIGDTSVRSRKNPELITTATRLVDLIDWSCDVQEPLLTCSFSREKLSKLRVDPMKVPDFPVHGQSIERCVQEVTKASATVYGEERRDGFIRATLAHRNVLPVNESKQDLIKMTE